MERRKGIEYHTSRKMLLPAPRAPHPSPQRSYDHEQLRKSIEKRAGLSYNIAMNYKVVETCTVTDEVIERILNEWTAKGYVFESIQFVTSVSSKRPTMAFVFFTKQA
jgi:hypothetical protein